MRSDRDTDSSPGARVALAALIALALMAAPGWASEPSAAPLLPGSRALETVEEATESLVNALIDMAVAARSGDASDVSPFLGEQVSLRLPVIPGEKTAAWRLIDNQAWTLSAAPPRLTHARAVAGFGELLGRFRSIEDVRFKLKDSHPVGASMDAFEAHFKSWIVGRNLKGQREWLRGTGELAARRGAGGRWIVEELVFDEASSLIATRDLFSEVSAPAGIARKDPSFLERGGTGLIAHGVAVADVDRDGLLDVFAPGLTSSALFRNKGDGTFEDVARAARVAVGPAPGGGPLVLDFDNDGDADLFLSAVGKQSLFENRLVPDGKLAFRDISSRARVDVDTAAFSAAAGDVNGDGLTDIYVACYNHYGKVIPDSWDRATNGLPNLLFVNVGDGTFREAAAEFGVADSRWSYGAELADADDDGDLDLYVANDFGGPMGFFVNEVKQTGRFRDVAAERGLDGPGYGMGVSFGDYDLDGDLDLHLTRMSSTAGNRVLGRFGETDVPDKDTLRILASGNALYQNTGGAHYKDVTKTAGPFGGNWAWGGGFFDADNDGFPDLYTPNGFLSGTRLHDT
jgi:hypothetical protein